MASFFCVDIYIKMNKILVLLTILILSSCVKLKKVDLVIHNAKIYTVNQDFEIAQAMAITDGEIVAIGKEHEIMNKYRADEFFDAQTQPIYPGFIDVHSHFIGYGLNQLGVNVSEATNLDEMITLLKDYEKNNLETDWIIGYGWNPEKWTGKFQPERLDTAFDKPVLIWRKDGHQLMVNQLAGEKAGVGIEYATLRIVGDQLISKFVEAIEYTKGQKKQAIRLAQIECLKNGLTSVTDAGITNDELLLLQQFERNGNLDVKVYGMLKPTPDNLKWAPKNGVYKGDYLHVTSFKFMADGSLGSRSACLLKNYNDLNTNGNLLLTKEELLSYANTCKALGYQMNVHCIGDSTFRVVTDVMAEVLQNQNDLRWRIEHAQIIDPNDIDKLGQYSILPSVQPIHGVSDMNWAVKRIGEERINKAYLLKKLKDQNGIIGFGTDFPVETMNPIQTFYDAVARKDKEGSTFSYLEKEKMSREEALKAMTFWAAMYQFEEYDKGSLEVGKKADFVILNRDIMDVEEEEILNAEVLYTFVNGLKMFGE